MKSNKNYTLIGMLLVVSLVLVVYCYQKFFVAPNSFPIGKNFTISENESLRSVSERLYQGGYIVSPLLFRAGVSYLNKDRAIQLGGYSFAEPSSLIGMIRTFVEGRPNYPLLSITVPEGSTSSEVSAIIAKAIPSLSLSHFNDLIIKDNAQGKLFPSTYYLLPSYTAEDILQLMLSTFIKKVETLLSSSKIAPPLTSENDVLVLASILEGESKTSDDMKIVSGILLNRLTKGMPLQVDVDKDTYKVKGLPKVPLNNPGLVAIDAALHPVFTDYLFYLTGEDGKMYYAKTFEEHKKNIKKYLKS